MTALVAGTVLLGGRPCLRAQSPHVALEQVQALNAGLPSPPDTLDRSTPRRSWAVFVESCRQEKYGQAVHILNLNAIAPADQRATGPGLANWLCVLLRKVGQLRAGELSDESIGPLASDGKPKNQVVVARISAAEGPAREIWLQATAIVSAAGRTVWVVRPKSVSLIEDTYEQVVLGKVVQVIDVVNRGLGPLPLTLQLGSPRLATGTFIALTSRGEFDRAAHLLEMKGMSDLAQRRDGRRHARRLALLLLRLRPEGFSGLSNDETGSKEKGVPSDEEVLVQKKVENGSYDLRLKRHKIKGRTGYVWVFSPETVGQVDAYYKAIGYGVAGDHLPTFFFRVQLWDVQLWQYLGLALGLVLAWVFGLIVSFLLRKVLGRLSAMTKNDWDDSLVAAAGMPLRVIFLALGYSVVISAMALAPAPLEFIYRAVKLLGLLGGGWFLVRAVDVLADFLHDKARRRQDEVSLAIVPIARKILRPIMCLVVILMVLQNAGVQVTVLLGALSIGGLAIAMAGKATAENLLGGIMIALDRPFKVGDVIKLGEFCGMVEEVGVRSTKLRTLERTLVTVPNGQVADSKIENFAARDKLRLQVPVGVRYDTTLDQLLLIVDEIKRHLVTRPDVEDGFATRVSEFRDSAVVIEVALYIRTNNWDRYTAAREEILLAIAGIVGRAGVSFAFPSQTVYMARAAVSDQRQAEQAAATVSERRAVGEFCIPEIPRAVLERLRRGQGDTGAV
jgi:MscS family membrane protein